MDDIIKHPYVVLFALASIGLSSLVNLKLNADPYARPDAYTKTDATGRAAYVDERYEIRENVVDRRLRELDDAVTAERQWRDAHLEWGNAINARNEGRYERHEANIQELRRRVP